jgi:hypothetical protein
LLPQEEDVTIASHQRCGTQRCTRDWACARSTFGSTYRQRRLCGRFVAMDNVPV